MLRQVPAHAFLHDEYDSDYFDQQNRLISDAYGLLRSLRLLLHTLPELEGFEFPLWMTEDRVVVY